MLDSVKAAWGAGADSAAARSHSHSPDEETSLDPGIQAGCCNSPPLVLVLLLVLILILVLIRTCL